MGAPIANFYSNWSFVDYLCATVNTRYDSRLREDWSAYRVNPLKAIKLSEETFSNPMKKSISRTWRRA